MMKIWKAAATITVASLVITPFSECSPVFAADAMSSGQITLNRYATLPAGLGTNGFSFSQMPVKSAIYHVYAADTIMDGEAEILQKDQRAGVITVTDGVGVLTGLHDGTYYLVEEGVIPGQIPESARTDVTVSNGVGTATITSGNVPVTLNLSVMDNVTGASVSGISMQLRSKSAVTGADGNTLVDAGETVMERVTGAGAVVMDNLTCSDYEAAFVIPDGYVGAGTEKIVSYTIPADTWSKVNLTESVSLDELQASFSMEQTGFKVGLYQSENGKKGKLYDSWTTDGSTHTINKLSAGDYILSVINAPAGYASVKDQNVRIEDKAGVQNFSVTAEETKLAVSANTTGSMVSLHKVQADGSIGAKVDAWETSSSEPHKINKLPVGEYVLVMDKAAEGYQKAKPVSVSISDSGKEQNTSISCKKTYGKVSVGYYDDEVAESGMHSEKKGLSNVQIDIVDEAGAVVASAVTDANGKANFENLPVAAYKDGKVDHYIKYTAVVNGFPHGYLKCDGTEFMFNYINDSTPVVEAEAQMESQRIKGTITVNQIGDMAVGSNEIDSDYGKIYSFHFEKLALNGAEYAVYTDAECTNEVSRLLINKEGKATTEALELGTYYVKQTKVPKGYAKDTEIHEVLLDSGEDHETAVINANQNNTAAAVDVALKLYTKGEVMEIKNGKYYYKEKVVPGVVFGIYCAKDIISPKDGMIVAPAGSQVGIIKTDENGVGTIIGKLVEGSYYYRALTTASGYALDSAKTYEFAVTLSNDAVEEFDVNKKNPYRVVMKKGAVVLTNLVNGSKEAVTGAEYKLYTNEDELIGTYYTDKNGKISIGDLPQGSYYLVQTKAEGYELLDSVIEFEVSDEKGATLLAHNVKLPESEPITEKHEDVNVASASEDVASKGNPISDVPETGDHSPFMLMLSGMAAAGVAVLSGKRRKKAVSDSNEN